MPELVGNDVLQTRLASGTVQLVTQSAGRDPPALMGEEEFDELSIARMAKGTTGRALGGYPIDQLHGLLVDRHHPLGEQLAEGHLHPGALAGDLVHAVKLEVAQLADAQPSFSQK
jgi:hypothetical protein